MAGHSHWANVKRKKEKSAKQRSAAFTRAAKMIMTAVREGGPNPESNSMLSAAIEYARSVNMPKDNIERIIKKFSGQLKSGDIKRAIYEIYAPGGLPMLISVASDNLNRTLNELRQLLSELGGKMADKGAVSWQFKEVGLVRVRIKDSQSFDECTLEILDLNIPAEDIVDLGQECAVLVPKTDVADVAAKLKQAGYTVKFAGRFFVSSQDTQFDHEKVKEFLERLDEHPEVEAFYLGCKLKEALTLV